MPELSQNDLSAIARDYFQHLLRCENEDIYKMREIDGFDHDDIKDFGLKRSAIITQLENQPPATNPDARKWLDKHGHAHVDKLSDSFSVLNQYFCRAKLEAIKIGQAKMLGNMAGTVSTDPLYCGIMNDTNLGLEEVHNRYFPSLPLNPNLLLNEGYDANTTLLTAINKFTAYKKNLKAWSVKTEAENTKSLDWFKEIMGDERLIATIRPSDIAVFQNMLFNVPKGATQKLKTKSLKEAIQNKKDGMDSLTENTIVKYMVAIRSLLYWAHDEGLIDKVPGNNVFLKLKGNKSDKMPFDQNEMTLLYRSPLFTGCRSEKSRANDGPFIYKNAHYWIFLILAFTGARLGEIVQLEIEDIKQHDGVWFFDINDDELKKIKTTNSRRKAPIHDFLIEIGFLEFYQRRLKDKKTGKLFSEIVADNPEGAFSKIGNRYLDNIGLNERKHSMHSLRHTFTDACRTAEVNESHRKQIMGHSEGGMAKIYGIGADIKALRNSINRVKYDFMDDFRPNPPGKTIINR